MTSTRWSGLFRAALLDAFQAAPSALIGENLTSQLIEMLGAARVGGPKKVGPVESLAKIRAELEVAIGAITELENTAAAAEKRAAELKGEVAKLTTDQQTAKTLLSADKESVGRFLGDANRRGRIRGWIEALIVGAAASLIASAIWYFAVQA